MAKPLEKLVNEPLNAPSIKAQQTAEQQIVVQSRKLGLFHVLSLFLILFAAFLPGNAPWINDEPKLLSRALTANLEHTLPTTGLKGSLHIHYGPVPTWFYQGVLLITDDPITMTVMKSLLTTCIVFFSLYLISMIIGYSKWPLLLTLVSPYLYFYSRLLWDNCMLIPLSAILFASFAVLSKRKSVLAFYLSLLCVGLLLEIHLMSLFILGPFFLTLLVYERSFLLERWKHVLSGTLLLGLFIWPYVSLIVPKGYSKRVFTGDFLASVKNALSGAEFFSFLGFLDYFVPEFLAEGAPFSQFGFPILISLTGIAYLFFTLGLLGTFRKQTLNSLLPKYAETESKLLFFSLVAIGTTLAAYLYSGIKHHPQYMNAVWFPFFFLMWRFLSKNFDRLSVRVLFGAQFVLISVLLFSFVGYIDRYQGSRGIHHGATLNNQLKLIEEASRYAAESPIVFKNYQYRRFPQGFNVLRQLTATEQFAGDKPLAVLTIDYADPKNPLSGEIVLSTGK